MNRLIVVYLLFLLTAPACPLLAQRGVWSAGLEGGPGFSLIYGSESVYSHSSPVLSGAAGLFGEYGFAPAFSAKVALHYERISTITDNLSALLPQGGKLRYNLDYLSLPVLVKWSSGSRIRFFANAGPCFSPLLQESLWYQPENGGKEKVPDETGSYLRVNLAVTAGIGMAGPLGKKLLVSLELRDNCGVLNIHSGASDFECNSYFLTAAPTGYTNSTLLPAGVCYRFGGNKGMSCTSNDPGFQYPNK